MSQIKDLVPGDIALRIAKRLMTQLALNVPGMTAIRQESTGEDGCIYIYWRKPGLSLQLDVPNSEVANVTLYRYSPPANLLIKNATIADLTQELEAFSTYF